MIDLRAEWKHCILACGGEPTADRWHKWTTDVLEQVRTSEPVAFLCPTCGSRGYVKDGATTVTNGPMNRIVD
jgi:hypothetical protein